MSPGSARPAAPRVRPARPGPLRVEGLTVGWPGAREPVLRDVALAVDEGERVGLVGPSGAGKTTLLLAVLGLLPPGARVAGRITWGPDELTALPPGELRRVRGREIGMVFQDAASALHPLHRVDRQVAEALAGGAPSAADRARAARLLRDMGLASPGRRWPWPHELSGGQRQRVMVAMASALEPALLLADEPTTALDPPVRLALLELLEARRRAVGASLLLVSHDPEVIAHATDRVLRIEAGRVGPVPGSPGSGGRRRAPSSHAPPGPAGRPAPAPPRPPPSSAPLVEVRGLRVAYRARRLLGRHPPVEAVRGVDLAVHAGETLALVGPSGAGKSTLARALLGLQAATAGEVRVRGDAVDPGGRRWSRDHRRQVQIVFQDPVDALHPLRPVGRQIARVLRALAPPDGRPEAERVAGLLQEVALPAAAAGRLPRALSAGERQRACIARALAAGPSAVVLDEPVSSLDAAVRSEILALLGRLQARRGAGYLLISHDLGLVRDLAHRVAVMEAGRIVEEGTVDDVLRSPRHPCTRRLVEAAEALAAPRPPSASPGPSG